MSFLDTSVYDSCWIQANQSFKTAAGPNTLLFENRKFPLPIGQPVMVPRGVVNLWLGNPDARDHPTDKDLRHRTQELVRVSKKWGNEVGAPPSFPDIQAWDINQNVLPTIVADPRGESVAEPDPQAISQAQMAKQQQALATALATLRQYAAQEGIDLGEITGTELPEPGAPKLAPPPSNSDLVPAPEFRPAEAPPAVADIPDAPAWATEPTPAPDATSLPEPPDPTVAKKAPSRKAPAAKPKTPVS